ncbi:MAG: hypothetical protein ACMUHX_06605 [bacterium]
MPHIFFERLEQRKNTQSLIGFGSEFLGNTNLFGGSPYSSYYPSANSLSTYGSYGQYELSVFNPSFQPVCFLKPFPVCYIPPPLFGLDFVEFTNPQVYNNNVWSSPVTNSLFNGFSQTYLSTQNGLTAPFSSGNVFNPGFGSNPLSSPFSTGNFMAPSWGQGILPSPASDNSILPVTDINLDRLSKLGKMRENLIALFRNKGILSDKQGQRLLCSPSDRA